MIDFSGYGVYFFYLAILILMYNHQKRRIIWQDEKNQRKKYL
jgi:hypothetical protein